MFAIDYFYFSQQNKCLHSLALFYEMIFHNFELRPELHLKLSRDLKENKNLNL